MCYEHYATVVSGSISKVRSNWQLRFKCSVKPNLSQRKNFLTAVWIRWKLDGGRLLPDFIIYGPTGTKAVIKSGLLKGTAHLEMCAYSKQQHELVSCGVHLPAEDTPWIQHSISGLGMIEPMIPPLCVFHFFFWTYNSKMNYGYRFIKNSRWNFKAMRQGNLLSY